MIWKILFIITFILFITSIFFLRNAIKERDYYGEELLAKKKNEPATAANVVFTTTSMPVKDFAVEFETGGFIPFDEIPLEYVISDKLCKELLNYCMVEKDDIRGVIRINMKVVDMHDRSNYRIYRTGLSETGRGDG